ncbi:MAG TPA: hypothetical protein VFP62_11350, partial [Burkholderiales bacterium]|nr:hypothetical protein [Burkholderiales bacterium]
MCPACVATAAWIVGGVTSAGGIAALAVKLNHKESDVNTDVSNSVRPRVASREAWLRARKALLAKEKAFNIE